MEYQAHQNLIYRLLVAAFLLCCTAPVSSVILHPAGEPNLATWTDRPDPNAIGRWANTASCVAVSSNCVISTRHQGGSIGTQVEIGGRTYNVAQIWNHNTADLKVAKLSGANLTSFVSLYENTDEISKNIVIGGYGNGRSSLLQTGGTTYGYEWDNASNTTRRLGTNKINDTEDSNTISSFTSDIIIADFDGLNEGQSTTYESTVARHDSGCGWFIKVGNTWKVAGLSRTVNTHYEEGHDGEPNYILYESWFRDRANPQILQPDYLDAVRISSYAAWISQTIPQRLPADLTGDDFVDFADFAVFARYWSNQQCQAPDFCAGADCEPDGDVDPNDLACLVNGWLCDWDCY
jgi:hypothetical protein